MRNLVALILPTGSLNAAGGTAANAQGQPSFAQVVFLAASATGARSLVYSAAPRNLQTMRVFIVRNGGTFGRDSSDRTGAEIRLSLELLCHQNRFLLWAPA